jgi:25S rRNA (uracil2634-N3)-methyltransferase
MQVNMTCYPHMKDLFSYFFLGAGIKDQEVNIRTNQTLVLNFLQTAAEFLQCADDDVQKTGEIHVTLKSCEPYVSWDVKSLARQTGKLKTLTTVPFVAAAFPGYAHRRTIGFKEGLSAENNEEITDKDCKTFVFVRSGLHTAT